MPRTFLPIGIALSFLAAISTATALGVPAVAANPLLVLSVAAAAYLALNIGANDVANNMGPAVGSRALTIGAALCIAAVFDFAGAMLAGGDVIDTVGNGLLATPQIASGKLMLVFLSAIIGGALWINLSTVFGTPVSTTHAIIGGIIGAAVAAGGWGTVSWPTLGVIALSWIVSPILGALFAALIHSVIRATITRRPNKIDAARLWVPVLVAVISGIFVLYLATEGSGGHWNLSWTEIAGLSLGATALSWIVAMPWVRRRSLRLENRKKQVSKLFRPPLIIAAALLSFAHGANDVANVAAPLIAILSLSEQASAAIGPQGWTILIGASGIALGIVLFGPRVIHTIGEQITRLNEIRAFCVASSAAVTVLTASALGLPVSSTHVAVGAIFGVGFLREYLSIRNMNGAAVPVLTRFVEASTLNDSPEQAIRRERRNERRYLVRRLNLARIAGAWMMTLPAAAAMGAAAYFVASAFPTS